MSELQPPQQEAPEASNGSRGDQGERKTVLTEWSEKSNSVLVKKPLRDRGCDCPEASP